MSNKGPEKKEKKEKKEKRDKKEKHVDIGTRLSSIALKDPVPATDSPKVRGSWIKNSPTTLYRKLSSADQGMPPIPTDPLPAPPKAAVPNKPEEKKTKKEKKHHHKEKKEHRRAEGDAPKGKNLVEPQDGPLVATKPLKSALPTSSTPRPAYVGLDNQPQINDLHTRALAATAQLEELAVDIPSQKPSPQGAPILTVAVASRSANTQVTMPTSTPMVKPAAKVSP